MVLVDVDIMRGAFKVKAHQSLVRDFLKKSLQWRRVDRLIEAADEKDPAIDNGLFLHPSY